jgi:hypothetical protein
MSYAAFRLMVYFAFLIFFCPCPFASEKASYFNRPLPLPEIGLDF